MEIPKKFKVGRYWHTINRVEKIPNRPDWRGGIHYLWRTITLATHRGKVPRAPKMQAEAFWHETTHAILYDMGSELYTDEAFVHEFSKRLNQVVHSAKF